RVGDNVIAVDLSNAQVPSSNYYIKVDLNNHAGSPSIEVKALEVTQGVQDARNSVGLVQGKTTFVRVHVKSLLATTIGHVSARLIGKRNGVALPSSPISPINEANGNLFGEI